MTRQSLRSNVVLFGMLVASAGAAVGIAPTTERAEHGGYAPAAFVPPPTLPISKLEMSPGGSPVSVPLEVWKAADNQYRALFEDSKLAALPADTVTGQVTMKADWEFKDGAATFEGDYTGAPKDPTGTGARTVWRLLLSNNIAIGVDGTELTVTIEECSNGGSLETIDVIEVPSGHSVRIFDQTGTVLLAQLTSPGTWSYCFGGADPVAPIEVHGIKAENLATADKLKNLAAFAGKTPEVRQMTTARFEKVRARTNTLKAKLHERTKSWGPEVKK